MKIQSIIIWCVVRCVVRYSIICLSFLFSTQWANIVPAYAQTGTLQTATQLNTEINSKFSDQNIGAITPYILRQFNLDMVASSVLRGAVPAIASGFCSTGTATIITNSNSSAVFDILVGTATCGSTGTISMPNATTGWVCSFANVTSPTNQYVNQTGGTVATVVTTNYSRTAGTAMNFNPSDHVRAMCMAN